MDAFLTHLTFSFVTPQVTQSNFKPFTCPPRIEEGSCIQWLTPGKSATSGILTHLIRNSQASAAMASDSSSLGSLGMCNSITFPAKANGMRVGARVGS